jgi:ABC-type transporter Mla subunit MlaD
MTLLVAGAGFAAFMVASATAGDETSYKVEFDNAFGIVDGSEVRVAGVKAGTVTDLDINGEKKALISFKIENQFGKLMSDATCSAEPQSLIAEYFVDCQPGVSDQELVDNTIPVEQTTLTVPNDLVLNTFRKPYKDRLQLLINEFGTALTGNGEALNAAILRGAPALRDLRSVLDILAQQNTVIRDLNSNGDAIISRLNERREDVVTFINEADATASASAERREELGETFKLLPGFLAELQPTMRELGRVAEEGKPLLTDLKRTAPRLNRLADLLPAFNNAGAGALTSLGNAAEVGTRALTKGQDEINLLRTSTVNAPRAADIVTDFLESIDDPQNAVEEDARARKDLSAQPGEADRRVDILNQKVGGGVTEPGYSGMEGLLNYAYYQAGALNQYDQWGHILHLNLVQTPVIGECAHYNAGPFYPNGSANPQEAPPCVSILGDNQPGIGVETGPTAGLPRYDGSVCPHGSTDLALCDPTVFTHGGGVRKGAGATGRAQAPAEPPLTAKDLEGIEADKPLPAKVQEALDLENGAPLSQNPELQQLLESLGITPPPQSPSTQSAEMNQGLLDFLFGS